MSKAAFYIDCTPDGARLMDSFERTLTQNLDVHIGDPHLNDLPALLKGRTHLVNGHTVMSADLLDHLAPELKRIVYLGTGPANYIDLAAARRLGIEIATVSKYGDRSVAEHAFALMMAAARDVAAMDRALRQGTWLQKPGIELQGKSIGIVGYGGIGREMASMCQGFGMKVQVWNRSPVDLPTPLNLAPDLRHLFQNADIVSLHLALTSETANIIDADLLNSMGQGSILINTARAELVDPVALHNCLENGPIAHAAIDTFAPEPISADDPLLRLPNVTLTAHVAWKTPDASRRLLKMGLQKLWAE